MALHIRKMKSVCGSSRLYPSVLRCAMLSSQPAPALESNLQHYRTSETNPLQHTRDHVAKYYVMPNNVKNKLFLCGGIPGSMEDQIKTFRECGLMVREQTLEVMNFLKSVNFQNPAVRFVLYGKYGTGKTLSLMHLIHYGFQSKFLLVHAPWVSIWTKRPKEVVVSQFKEGRIDLPVESAMWLQHFKQQNASLMEELKLEVTQSYTWSKREVTEKGAPLTDVIEHGIARVRHSSDCLAVLMKEIKHHSQSGKFKTLVVVDGVNAIYSKTNVKRADKTLVNASDITIVHALKKLLKSDWNNAAIITTVDTLPHNRHFSMQDPCTPYVLLGQEGFELLDPFVPVETVNYTDKELDSALDYYIDRLWVSSERIRGEEGRKQLRFLSGYNPLTLMKLCDPL